MTASTTVHDLRTLILSSYPLIAIETLEEDRARGLLRSVAADLGMPLFEWRVTRGLSKDGEDRSIGGTEDPIIVLQHLQGLTVEGLFWLHDFADFLKEPGPGRELREVVARFTRSQSAVILTGPTVELPSDLDAQAAHLELQLPAREELRTVVRSVLRSVQSRHRVTVELGTRDMERLLDAVQGMTANQARQAVAYAALRDGNMNADDIALVHERKASAMMERGPLEYFPAEDSPYELGGFDRLKSWLERAEMGLRPEARELGLPAPRGILLIGVQGCGKSLAAKAIARGWGRPLLKLDAGSLYGKYLGESEKNMRRAIEIAEAMAPTILWIDEIEKGFSTGPSDVDGGTSRRLFGTLLTWMQEKRADVFLVATANDVFALPPELLRKGRFDEIFFVDLPDAEDRETIFGIHLRRLKQDPEGFELARLVDASDGFSGAEIEQAVVAGMYRALHERKALDVETLLREIEGTVPLSRSRSEDLERLRDLARGRFVPVK